MIALSFLALSAYNATDIVMKNIFEWLKKNNKWICVVIALAMVAIGVIAFFAINHDRTRMVEGEITFYMTYDKKDSYLVYKTEDREYKQLEILEGEKSTLRIYNGRDDIKSIYVMLTDESDNVVIEEKISGADEQHNIEMNIDARMEYNLSFVVVGENDMEFHISDENIFMQIIADERVEARSVYMMKDMSVVSSEDIIFNYCFDWYAQGYSFITDNALVFRSSEEGQMNIYNGGSSVFKTGLITCYTPLWDYDISKTFGEFCEEFYFYINAKSINDRDIDTQSLYVDSKEKLESIIAYDSDGSDADTRTGKLVVPENVHNVTIVGDYDIGTVNVEGKLTIVIKGASDVTFVGKEVTLIWEGDDAPSSDMVERYMQVKTYNGEDMDENIGGTTSCEFISGTLQLSLARANEMVVDGNYIDVYSGYVDNIEPTEATFNYELSDEGSAKIVKIEDSYYCIITDGEGSTRGYKLNFVKKSYNLPVIYIETENGVGITSKEDTVRGTFSMDYNGNETFTDVENVTMDIRGRGHSSWKLAKKPYKIKFHKKLSLFGLTEAKEWVLQANHADKSLIRNKLAMDMGAVLDKVLFTPHSYNVDVFVNGEYMGVYTLTEQIEVKKGRLEGEKDSSDIDTDYLLELGGGGEATSFGNNRFNATLSLYVEIKNPDSDVLTKEQYDFIKNYVDEADKAVKNLDGYQEYIDIPSLIDWFILNEFSYNIDGTFRRSDYIMKKKDDKLYMATYWDYDYAFGNFWRDSVAFDEWICYGNENTLDDNYIWDNWMRYLLKDKSFTDQLKARWDEVGEELYQVAIATIDNAEINISMSAEENFLRWPDVLGKKTQYEFWKTAKISTYEGQLQYLREFIEKRYKWMDKTINAM